MSQWLRTWWPCVVVWFIVAAIYLVAAIRQNNTLNLSATAGGQYPYLVYAQRMAEEGWWGYFGDRNRMPLYPALLSLVHVTNWDDFVTRSSYFAIGSSLAAIVMIGVGAYAALPKLHATVFTTIVTVTIFSKYASFVQAELLYYALFFISWLSLCKLLKQPSVRLGAIAGATLGFCYLTKASALPLQVAFAFVAVSQQVYQVVCKRTLESRATRGFAALAALFVCFLVVSGPYLKSNYDRFGKLFYNVNSTFFMWCDSWSEAEAFANKYKIDQQFPAATRDEIPNAVRYWRTHSGDQIIKRFGYGVDTVTRLLWQERVALHMLLTSTLCIGMFIAYRIKLQHLLAGEWSAVLFTTITVFGYELVYVWYAQVAFGERFVLSLVLPCLFGAFWILKKIESNPAIQSRSAVTTETSKILLALMLVLAVVDGTILASTNPKPDPTFALFYNNESRSRELAGDLREATKGYAGVLRLDPDFAAAHQSLGMIALRTGDVEQAVEQLARTVELQPNSADSRNSLGSALLQAGKMKEAIQQFEAAVAVNPKMAVAWYNLGGSYWTIGDSENAQRVLDKLKSLDARFADQLEDLMSSSK